MGLLNWMRGEWGGGKIARDATYWQKREIVTVRGMTHQPKRGWRAVPNTDMNLSRGRSGWFQVQAKETVGMARQADVGPGYGHVEPASTELTTLSSSPWFWFRSRHAHAMETYDTRNDPRVMDDTYYNVSRGHQPPEPGPAAYPTGEPIVEAWPSAGDPRGDPPPGYTSW